VKDPGCFFSTLSRLVLIVVILLMGCRPVDVDPPRQPISNAGGDLEAAAGAQGVMDAFLQAWEAEDYPGMYAYLTPLSRDALSLEAFTEIYQNTAQSLTLESLKTDVLSALAEAYHAEVSYRLNFETRLFGTLTRDTVAALTREQEGWRIQWEIGMLLPELRGGNRLEFVNELPSRGRIFDRKGAPLAAYDNALAIGLVPGEVLPDQAENLYATLAEISFYDPDSLATGGFHP